MHLNSEISLSKNIYNGFISFYIISVASFAESHDLTKINAYSSGEFENTFRKVEFTFITFRNEMLFFSKSICCTIRSPWNKHNENECKPNQHGNPYMTYITYHEVRQHS